MSDQPQENKIEEAVRRFEERHSNAPAPEPIALADAAAEELGVEPDSIPVPPGIVRGVFVFELEDGTFGFRNMGEGELDIMDAIALANRLVEGARAELIVMKLAAYMQHERQQRERTVSVPVLPRRLGRRPQ